MGRIEKQKRQLIEESNKRMLDDVFNDVSFDVDIKNISKLPSGVVLHQVVEIGEFDLPNGYRKKVKLKPYHLIFGESSLSIFDVFNTDEVAGLTRRSCEEFITKLKLEGKTEKDDAFISGLVNFSEGTMFEFFNMESLSRPNNEYRIIPHKSVYVARNLISLFENPSIDTKEVAWYLNDNAQDFTKLDDDTEEFFAEVIERVSEIAFTRYNMIKIM